jgi:hypothetical protein
MTRRWGREKRAHQLALALHQRDLLHEQVQRRRDQELAEIKIHYRQAIAEVSWCYEWMKNLSDELAVLLEYRSLPKSARAVLGHRYEELQAMPVWDGPPTEKASLLA